MKMKNIYIVLLLSYGSILSAMEGSSSTHAGFSGSQAGKAAGKVESVELQDGIHATADEQDALLSKYEDYFHVIDAKLKQKEPLNTTESDYVQKIDEELKLLASTDRQNIKAADDGIRNRAITLAIRFRPLLNKLKTAGLFVASDKPLLERPEPSAVDREAQLKKDALAVERTRKAALKLMKKQEEERKQADEKQELLAKLDKHEEKQENQLTDWENAAARFESAFKKAHYDSQPLDRKTIDSFYVMKDAAFFLSNNREQAMTDAIFRRAIEVHTRFENFLNAPVGAFLLGKESNPLTKPAAQQIDPCKQATSSTGASIQKPTVPTKGAAVLKVEPQKQPSSSIGVSTQKPKAPAGRGGRNSKPGRSWWKSIGLIGGGVGLLYGVYYICTSIETEDEKKA